MNEQTAAPDTSCPLRHLAEVFGGKWKLPILCILARGPARYSAVKRRLEGVTNVMLTQSLRELERFGIISRRQFNEVPPRVEYALTEKGRGTLPFLTAAAAWAADDLAENGRESECAVCSEKSAERCVRIRCTSRS